MSDPAVQIREAFCIHRTDQGDAASLQGLTLTVAAGDRVCVLGPSGAGKTTLLRVIAGLQRPSAGEVRVLGRDVARLSRRECSELRHRHIGFLHQHAERALSPELHLEEAVGLPLALRGVGRRARRRRTHELLQAAGLADRAGASPRELSGGERQRAAVCAALVHRPALLLADEPTAELDAVSAAAVAELLHGLAVGAGATLIVVSHDASMAGTAERVLRIRDGRVVEDQGALVVGAGGWLRLDEELLASGGISRRATARAGPRGLLLTPTPEFPDVARAVPARSATSRRRHAVRVALHAVCRTRGVDGARRTVIDEMTREFAPGRLTLVTGRSGTGKTTLLELVGLLAAPTGGELVLDGQPTGSLDGERRAALRRAVIGYLPQEPVPVGFLSAEENVSLALRIRGRRAGEAAASAHEALTAVGLADLRRQRVARLSAGEAQRVGVARALACADGLLVLDEPTSRLDEASAAAVGDLLRAAATDGQTVICASHDPQLIRRADDVLELGPQLV